MTHGPLTQHLMIETVLTAVAVIVFFGLLFVAVVVYVFDEMFGDMEP